MILILAAKNAKKNRHQSIEAILYGPGAAAKSFDAGAGSTDVTAQGTDAGAKSSKLEQKSTGAGAKSCKLELKAQ